MADFDPFPPPPSPTPPARFRWPTGWRWAGLVAALLVCAVAVVFASLLGFVFLFYGNYVVASQAMEPALPAGSHVWTRPAGGAGIDAGDIVLLQPPAYLDVPPPALVVDRVVAVGGHTVQAVAGRLLVDGAAVSEPYLALGTETRSLPKTTVPRGMVYVLGDNRADSMGSRVFGPISVSSIDQIVVRTHAPSVKQMLLAGAAALVVAGISSAAVYRSLRKS